MPQAHSTIKLGWLLDLIVVCPFGSPHCRYLAYFLMICIYSIAFYYNCLLPCNCSASTLLPQGFRKSCQYPLQQLDQVSGVGDNLNQCDTYRLLEKSSREPDPPLQSHTSRRIFTSSSDLLPYPRTRTA